MIYGILPYADFGKQGNVIRESNVYSCTEIPPSLHHQPPLALDQRNVGTGSAYKGYAPSSSIMYHVNRLNRQNVWWYTPFAYVAGATADNNYKVSAPYKVVTSRNKYSGEESSGKVKVFVNVHGFSPRPITVARNDKGIWKAYECSSVFVNVPAPASASTSDPL